MKKEKYFVTWFELRERIEQIELTLDFPKVYGIPRGGSVIAAMMKNPVMTPEEADIIIDDIRDSGRTAKQFEKYNKPIYFVFDIQEKDYCNGHQWFVFPYEQNEPEGIENNIVRILQNIGEDVSREGLQGTPERVSRMYKELMTPQEFDPTTFDSNGYNEMIIEKGIPFYTMCEHHMIPFFGEATVAYIPDKKIIGISKLARTVEYFARRLQIQERMTIQIADHLNQILKPSGIAVLLKARHLCQEMRGIKKKSETITSCLRGVFYDDPKCRNEFLNYK